MNLFLHIFILVPFSGFLISLLVHERRERLISMIGFGAAGLHLLCSMGFIAVWVIKGGVLLNVKDFIVFETRGYEFFIDFYFDKVAAVYLLVGAVLTFLVTIYSREYLHRERGYKQFFNTILFFYTGYNVAILSGNFETLFIGWEILGISSFLLIAFYRDRYLPVKNAVKVFSIYRVADVGIILAMWLSHHLWNGNITFIQLDNVELVNSQLQHHSLVGISISLLLLLAAAAKSAQLPFSSWLPRAMEGPTPSTAIFYGSLSVHLGVFLLLKTASFWEHQLSVRILIGLLGLLTGVVATGIARVQSSVKSQIAYASIAQIGIMFIEVAAGFENLALFHFAGNAFLRTYQLLVSPSVVSYLIREQFYNFVPRQKTVEDSLPRKIEYTFYILSLKEWNLDSMMYTYLWNPLKRLGRKMDFITLKRVIFVLIPAYLIGLYCTYHKEIVLPEIQHALPFVFSFLALVVILKSFTERNDVFLSWTLVNMGHFWIALAISFNELFTFAHVHLYLSGVAVCGILGYLILFRLKAIERDIDLNQFHGHSLRHPKTAFAFLLACLGITGFPITPTFIGEDLIFSHIHEDQAVLAFFVALSFILTGLALIRIYARVFLGPHVRSIFESAYRSS